MFQKIKDIIFQYEHMKVEACFFRRKMCYIIFSYLYAVATINVTVGLEVCEFREIVDQTKIILQALQKLSTQFSSKFMPKDNEDEGKTLSRFVKALNCI